MSIKLKVTLANLQELEIRRLLLELKQLDPEKPFIVYLSDQKKNRSNAANAYYWGVVLFKVSEITGYDPEEMHDYFKAKFALRTRFNFGELEEVPKSTKLMDTKEFFEYVEKIRMWALDKFNLYIEKPGDLSDEDFIRSIEYK